MLSENILKFKNHIYMRMKREDRVYSAYNLRNEYNAQFGFDYSKEELFGFFAKDNRFLNINGNQILLKEIIDKKIAEDLLYMDVDYIKDFIKQTYYINNVNEQVISEIVNKYRMDNKIVLKYDLQSHEVRNKDDFDNAIIQEGRISYKALEQVALFLEIGVTELVMELNTKNVFMNDEINMDYIYYKKPYQKTELEVVFEGGFGSNLVSEEENNVQYLLENSHLQLAKEVQFENILKIDIYPNELIACLVALSSLNLTSEFSTYYFDSQHLSAMRRLSIINNFKGGYCLTTIGSELVLKFKETLNENISFRMKSIVNEYCSTKELCKSIEVKNIDKEKRVWDSISVILRKVYTSNYYSATFINLIKLANDNEGTSLSDLCEIGLRHSKHKEIYEVLAGDKASSGIKPIMQGKDVCFKCKNTRCCGEGNSEMSLERLLTYRNHHVNDFISRLKRDYLTIELIEQDPLLIKFLIPYTLCTANKKMMIKLNIIEETDVLYKNTGLYCPSKDKWVVKNDLLV